MSRTLHTLTQATLALALTVLAVGPFVSAAENSQFPLLPVNEKAVAERIKTLTNDAPEDAKLVAYLDCGTQVETTNDFPVSIKKLPAEKQFTLPATFAKDGKMQLAVIQAAGANAVISELWIRQLEK